MIVMISTMPPDIVKNILSTPQTHLLYSFLIKSTDSIDSGLSAINSKQSKKASKY
jgi:hypothetical protein